METIGAALTDGWLGRASVQAWEAVTRCAFGRLGLRDAIALSGTEVTRVSTVTAELWNATGVVSGPCGSTFAAEPLPSGPPPHDERFTGNGSTPRAGQAGLAWS